MKKIILVILIIISIISISLCCLKINEYNTSDNENTKTKIDEVDNEIVKVSEEITQNETKLQNIKEQKKEEVELVETWKEKLNQIKDYM